MEKRRLVLLHSAACLVLALAVVVAWDVRQPARSAGPLVAPAAAGPAPSATSGSSSAARIVIIPPVAETARATPQGILTVNGTAEPGAEVDVLEGSAVVAAARAGSDGHFTTMSVGPLAPGDHQLSLRATAPDGRTQLLSDARLVVTVPADPADGAKVVLNQPGAAAKVLQEPEATVAAGPPLTPAPPPAAAAGVAPPPPPTQTAPAPTPTPGVTPQPDTPSPAAGPSPPPSGAAVREAVPGPTGAPPAPATTPPAAAEPAPPEAAPAIQGTPKSPAGRPAQAPPPRITPVPASSAPAAKAPSKVAAKPAPRVVKPPAPVRRAPPKIARPYPPAYVWVPGRQGLTVFGVPPRPATGRVVPRGSPRSGLSPIAGARH